MQRTTLLHLRIPFSFFLLPVFLFALSVQQASEWNNALISFIILHFLLYPASNSYNSYFDKDEGSIGGLKAPPPVTKELYYASLIFDLMAILIGSYFISLTFGVMLFVYGMASKAYSHPRIRLKKYPIIGWVTIFLFQGYFTFLMAFHAIHQASIEMLFRADIQFPALLSSLLLGGAYPMTQIYQHKEDSQRGDITISLKLGILGTFHFTAIMFTVATLGFLYYYLNYHSFEDFLLLQVFLAPVLGYFLWWYLKVRKNVKAADFDSTMRLNLISSLMLNLYFALQVIL